ncbi:MAG TPA: hypothetical protein VFX51_24880 [Solirubrobacteraceae bacterium]|nr:hypothetical protein [Solirubrobacteraceae bacterium]
MTLRGLIPSLGAGGSLIAAAVCAFAVFGGVLAFRGENPGTAQANSGDVVVPGRKVRAQTSSPGVLDTVVALAQTGRRQAARAPRVRGDARRVSVRRRGAARTAPRAGTTPAAPATPDTPPAAGRATPPAATPSPAAPDTPAAPATPELPSVKRTVEQTRGAVQPVVDAAPEPVQAPVERVADTVQDVAGTVDETVDGLTGTLLPGG